MTFCAWYGKLETNNWGPSDGLDGCCTTSQKMQAICLTSELKTEAAHTKFARKRGRPDQGDIGYRSSSQETLTTVLLEVTLCTTASGYAWRSEGGKQMVLYSAHSSVILTAVVATWPCPFSDQIVRHRGAALQSDEDSLSFSYQVERQPMTDILA